MNICIKMDLALNNLPRLIYHKTQKNNHLAEGLDKYRFLLALLNNQ